MTRPNTTRPDQGAGDDWTPEYEHWRHGGWYVTNVRYPSGAVGCVSRNYPDHEWRIVCHPAPLGQEPTYPNRDAAARAERALAAEEDRRTCPKPQDEPHHGAALGWRCELPRGHTGRHGPAH